MISYRNEISSDWKDIAALHALSWQRHYAGIFAEKYLMEDVLIDRQSVWEKRFNSLEQGRHIIIAEKDGEMAGFACTYLDRDPVFGALIDNLHVLREFQGEGIGLKLMQMSYDWVKSQREDQDVYLGVLVDNHPAKAFYLKAGGEKVNQFSEICPAGNMVTVEVMLWKERPFINRAVE